MLEESLKILNNNILITILLTLVIFGSLYIFSLFVNIKYIIKEKLYVKNKREFKFITIMLCVLFFILFMICFIIITQSINEYNKELQEIKYLYNLFNIAG